MRCGSPPSQLTWPERCARRPGSGFRVSPAHFAERYALFIIIALGESIVAVGTGLAGHEKDAAFAAALAVAFVGVAAIWWAYFDFTAAVLARVLANRPPEERGPLARDVFTLCHYPIVLGIILFAVAAKKTVAHPTEPLSGTGRFALAGGIAMFLIGFALGRYRIVRHVAYERVGAAVAAIVAVLVFPDLDALALMAIVVGVLVAGLACGGRAHACVPRGGARRPDAELARNDQGPARAGPQSLYGSWTSRPAIATPSGRSVCVTRIEPPTKPS